MAGSISRLIFGNDPVLNYQSMKIVVENYLQSKLDQAGEDPFISPILASDEVLKQFPETVFMVGDVDPLLDDATLFFHRLKTVGFHYSFGLIAEF